MELLHKSLNNPYLKQMVIKKIWTKQKENPDLIFDGTVQIENGQLIFTSPRGFGKYPMLLAGENVAIACNGKEVDYPVVIYEKEDIEVYTLDTLPHVDMQIELSKDKLTAFLTITRVKGKKYALVDAKPTNKLKIMAMCIEEKDPEAIELDQVISKLLEEGIVYGIQHEAILEAIQRNDRQIKIEVAKGLCPGESKDATIVYNFPKNDIENDQNPFNHRKIHSVNVGEIVAIKTAPRLGEPGIDVMGQPVMARQPVDMPILIRKGVELINDGNVAVATQAGRPILEGYKRKYLSVRPVYIVTGDVDMRVGNIDFYGDVIVTGSVLDGFTVKAGGSIQVYGDVMHASLFAHGDITINKKAMTAQIKAGGSTFSYKRIYQLLNELSERIENLCEAIKTVKNQPSFSTLDLQTKGDGPLIQLLLDYKFKDIPKQVQQLVGMVFKWGQTDIEVEVIKIADLLSKQLCNLGPIRIKSSEEVDLLLEEITKTKETMDGLIFNSSNINVGYVQNCDLQASGDINILGQGSITSSVAAEGSIVIPYGVVRGGKLIARDKIRALELGSTSDAEVHIRLLDNCVLEAAIVHPVIIIEFGSQMEIVQEHVRYLKAYPHEQRLYIQKA